MIKPVFSFDLAVQTFELLDIPSRRDLDTLFRLGVPPDAMIGTPPLMISHVIFDGSQFDFEHHCPPNMKGIRAMVFFIANEAGDPQDLVAWSCKTGQLASWWGRAWAIGQETIYRPRLTDDDALPIWRDPLNLLRANRRGIVLLRPEIAAGYLNDAGPLLAEDTNHRAELRRLLARPAPRILIPAAAEAA